MNHATYPSSSSQFPTHHGGLPDGGAASRGRDGLPLVLRPERLGGEGEAAELRADEAVLDQEHLEDVTARAGQEGQLKGGMGRGGQRSGIVRHLNK